MPLDFPNPADSTTYTDSTSGNTYIYANGSWSLQSILSATRGGTGFATFNRGDILYGNASGTLSKLSAGTVGQVLSTNGSGGDPTWVTVSSSGGGAGTVATSTQYYIAGYYPGAGASVSGSSSLQNDTANGVVSISHTTASTGYSTGALVVSGGVGISGGLFVAGAAVTLFQSVANNYLILNTGANVLRIQTETFSSRVRFFENMTTGSVGFFGTSGGTLYLGTDSGTQNGPITIRGNNTTGGGGNQRAQAFTLATATSNGIGTGGTMIFQTSTASAPVVGTSNILRTRLRIEGAATGTSNYESIIILGDTNSGTAWTSYLRGVDATGADVSAGEIQIQAGRSTGTGNADGISFYVSSSSTASTIINNANQIGRFIGTGLSIYPTTSSISTSSGALIVSGGVGVGGSLNVGALSKFSDHLEIKGSGPKELRLYETSGSFYVALKAGNVASSSKTFTLPTTTGNSGEYLQTDGFGVLSWAAVTSGVSAVNAGVGISIPSTSGSVTVSIGRPVVMNMASGFTPVGIGTDYNILRVPEGKNNTNTNYSIKKVVMGVGTTSSGTSTIRVEKSSGPHTGTFGFNLASAGSSWNVMSADLSLLSGLGETSWIAFAAGYGTVATGDRIRLNFTAVDSTHANFLVQMLLEEY